MNNETTYSIPGDTKKTISDRIKEKTSNDAGRITVSYDDYKVLLL